MKPLNALHRSRTVVGLLTVALVGLGGAACSSSDDGSSDGTRTVATDMGEVSVPDRARRVVAGDYFAAFTLMDLGVPLVGVAGSDYSDQDDAYRDAAADAARVGDFLELDTEAVAATDPDLIVRSIDTEQNVYDDLSDIAPTVVISFQQLSLDEVTTRIGEAVGRTDEAASLVDELASTSADIREKYADVLADNTVALVTPAEDGEWFSYGKGWTDLTVLTGAGVRLASSSAEQSEQSVSYSTEQLGRLEDADILLLDAFSDYAPFEKLSVWGNLPAVKDGRTVTVTTGTSSIGNALALLTEFTDGLDSLNLEGSQAR